MTLPMLKIEGLSIALPSHADRPLAVDGLSLDIHKGEIVCIVGGSGSGKSVTALALMGLLAPGLTVESGRALFEGTNLLTLSGRDRRRLNGRRIAMIFQEPSASLNPVVSVGEQVAEIFRLHGGLPASQIRARVLDLFREVRLPDPERLYHSYPHQLSGGQCQRVMIAAALALEPSLLIADEPTTALDVTTQADILKLLLELRQQRGTGILFITHDFGVVADIADRVAVMQSGRLVEQGPRDSVLDRPQASYTKRLIAAVPTLEPRRARSGLGERVLRATGLVKTFRRRAGWLRPGGTVAALDHVELDVHRGETVGLVGESGSGKTTLAQCVIRLVDADQGDICLGEASFSQLHGTQLREARRRVQIVFQNPAAALNPRHRILQAVAEGPIIHGTTRAQAEVEAQNLLQLVGLDGQAAGRFPHELSGGQKQRVCIARALAVGPDLLIADEAVSALDVSIQAQVLDLLATLQQQRGFGLLFITHDLRVASRICDRIAVMRRGRIIEEGDPATLFAHPREAYTRLLLDSVPGRGNRCGRRVATE
jgi:peptide/nickel transport system ATP-binding protein